MSGGSFGDTLEELEGPIIATGATVTSVSDNQTQTPAILCPMLMQTGRPQRNYCLTK
jgi:hypothetical protein